MQTFKPAGEELKELQLAASILEQANTRLGLAKKEVESCKAKLTDWLATQRKIVLDALPIGEMVMIEGVVLIEIGKMSKFDEKAFLLANPAEHQAFKRDMKVTKFKPIV